VQAAVGLLQAALAAKGQKIDRSAAEIETQKYLDEAMELLRGAVTNGFKNAEHLKKDISFDQLRGRADFQRLLAELEMRP
jgi:hypothetical protein